MKHNHTVKFNRTKRSKTDYKQNWHIIIHYCKVITMEAKNESWIVRTSTWSSSLVCCDPINWINVRQESCLPYNCFTFNALTLNIDAVYFVTLLQPTYLHMQPAHRELVGWHLNEVALPCVCEFVRTSQSCTHPTQTLQRWCWSGTCCVRL